MLADFCIDSGPPLTTQGFEPGSAGGKRKLGEVSEVRLLPIADALALLSYQNDYRIVEKARAVLGNRE